MQQAILRAVDKVVRRLARNLPLHKRLGDSFNVLEIAFLKAAYESASFYDEHLTTVPAFNNDLDLLTHSMGLARNSDLILEFGVASGRTISHIAKLANSTVYGFDSFEGLPEDWRSGFAKGAFAGSMPTVPENAILVKGWFDKTLPDFLLAHAGAVKFLHVDCDLYSSTKTIFDLLAPRILPGTVIVFDEYFNYPSWKKHEHRAFEEFKDLRGVKCKPIGFVPSHQQVAFIVESI